MGYFLLKACLTGLLVAAISELAKRSSALAAILAALPLTSLLAILWLYHDSRDRLQVAALTENIFWALIPSLLFFFAFPLLLRTGWRFCPALAIALLLMLGGYFLYAWLLGRLGIRL